MSARCSFCTRYAEIAEIVNKTEANCRQLAVRAWRYVRVEKRRRFDVSRGAHDELAARFFAAVTDGDLGSLVEVLACDAVVFGRWWWQGTVAAGVRLSPPNALPDLLAGWRPGSARRAGTSI